MSDGTPSISSLEADIAANRERLARTVDELAQKATPQAILKRQIEDAKARCYAATHTTEGDLRVERIAALAAAGAVLIAIGVWRRSRS